MIPGKALRSKAAGSGTWPDRLGSERRKANRSNPTPGCRQKVESIAELRDAIHFDDSERNKQRQTA
jgi:hypothetical protein